MDSPPDKSKRWAVYENNETIAVVPLNDLIEHKPEGCFCNPRIDQDKDDLKPTQVHSALDGRDSETLYI